MRESALAGTDGAAVSQPGFQTPGWYGTSVPTTVLGVLVRHGVYPDPYIGTNNMRIPDASDTHNARFKLSGFSHLPDKSNPWAKPYWFRKEFSLPKDYRGKKVWLNLDGINYRAEVWLNGKKLADAKDVAGMFKRFHFEVSGSLNPTGNNALAILIYPLDHPGDPIHEQLDGLKGSFGPNGGDCEISRNVTQYCTIGWDWIPAARDRNMGIWQHVWLEATGPVVVRDPAAFTDVKLPEADSAAVTLRLHLQNAETVEKKVEVVATIKPDGFDGEPIVVRTPVTLAPGALTEMKLKPEDHPGLTMSKPRLWWPVTYGDHPLYNLSVEAYVDGKLSYRSERKFGVRKVGSYLLPTGGRAFTVNGRTLRLTGGAWIPDFLMSWSAQRYRDEIRFMAEGNHTVVRVNGCGIVPPDAFFEACDRYGVMVWQDLSRTSYEKKYRKDGKKVWNAPACDDLALYLSNMRDSIIRLRGYPSMLVWCGSNEAAPVEAEGAALQNEILPELDGTRPWLPSSSEEPTWAKEPLRFWTGGPWHLVGLKQYFQLYASNKQFTARDEVGLPSVMPINSVVKSIPDWDQPDAASFPLNKTFGYHDACSKFQTLDTIMRKDLGQPLNVPEYLQMGDLYNEASYRAIFEAANKVRPRNAGTHIWKINAAWPGMMWQVFDWYLRPNAGYYSMRSACKPLHVQAAVDDFTVQVVSTLDKAQPGLSVKATVVGIDGAVQVEQRYPVDVAADTTVKLGALPEVVKDGRLHFVALDLVDNAGKSLDRTVYWMQKDCQWGELLQLGTAKVEAAVTAQSRDGEETVYTVRIANRSSVPALQVWTEVLCGTQGAEVLPSFWSDNALTLLPSEERTLEVRFRTVLLGRAQPHLMVEGFNVVPREIEVGSGKVVLLKPKIDIGAYENGQLAATVSNDGAGGSRYTTWPVELKVDDRLVRTFRVAANREKPQQTLVPLEKLSAGAHQVTVSIETSEGLVRKSQALPENK